MNESEASAEQMNQEKQDIRKILFDSIEYNSTCPKEKIDSVIDLYLTLENFHNSCEECTCVFSDNESIYYDFRSGSTHYGIEFYWGAKRKNKWANHYLIHCNDPLEKMNKLVKKLKMFLVLDK